jgi:hypothetical protein
MKKHQKLPVLILLMIFVGLVSTAYAQVTVDGTLSGTEGYGAPLATQTINTDFGDNTSSSGSSSGGSELDAVYSAATNGYLYLFIAGIAVGFNNKNTAGVNGTSGTAANPTAANAVTNGLELGIPLSALGNPTGSVQVLVCINGSSFVYLSNQFIQGF